MTTCARIAITVAILLAAFSAAAQPVSYLLPVFAEDVPGRFGSYWRSELRLYNGSPVEQIVTFSKVLPAPGQTCTLPPPIRLAPGEQQQLRSMGCGAGSISAAQLSADRAVALDAVIVNVAPGNQSSCCYSGFTQNIPIELSDVAFSTKRTLPNLDLPLTQDPVTNLNRHNVGFINRSDQTILVTFEYYRSDGGRWGPGFTYTEVSIPPQSLVFVGDFLHWNPAFELGIGAGYYRVHASGSGPFYCFSSDVDNATNDATFIRSR